VISNRNFRKLEDDVTSTKQTLDSKSNRNFRSTTFHPAEHLFGIGQLPRLTRTSALPAPAHRQNVAPITLFTAFGPVTLGSHFADFASALELRRGDCRLRDLRTTSAHRARTSAATISNRYWIRLEIAATPTKHSPGPISNRSKNMLVRIAWGSQFWLRDRSARPAHQHRLPTGVPRGDRLEDFLGEEL
jgi:hypothetical protein